MDTNGVEVVRHTTDGPWPDIANIVKCNFFFYFFVEVLIKSVNGVLDTA